MLLSGTANGVFYSTANNSSPLLFCADELASYPERFQEPMRPSEYQPGVGESRNSGVPPHFMEEGSRRLGDPSYSKNLDKITSALLELVARK